MSTDPFVAQLASLCRQERTRGKFVIVPAQAIGRTLGERLALDGVEWVNLRFATPLGLALQVAAPHLLGQGLDPLPEELCPSLVMRLLLELPADVPAYFRPLAEQPRMGAALWVVVRELRLAGMSPAALRREAFEDERKHAELCALLASYERHLAASGRADAADVYRAAAARASECPLRADDILLEAPGLGAALPLVRAFLDALPGRRVPPAVPRVPGLSTPRRSKDAPTLLQPAASRLAFLLAPGQAPPGVPGDHLELFHAAGREAEVEAVLRRILAASPSMPLDAVEIACASRDGAPLFWEKARRLDLPVTVEEGIPVAATRPARALLGLCDWIDSDFTANRLRRLVQSGDLRVSFPDRAGGGRAARLLAASGATWGRDTYGQSLGALAARDRALADGSEELDEEERTHRRARADQADFLCTWVGELLALVPVPAEDGRIALSEVVSGLSTMVESRVTPAGPLDAAALAAIGGALARLLPMGAFRCPMRQALAMVRDAVERLAVGGSRARPGHLHVSPLATAGYAGRPFTFVVGLEEGGVFPSLIEDPVLLDAERDRISTDLPTSHDRLEESVHAVVSRLAVLPMPSGPARGGVCLSYSCRDLREGRETAPSWLMLQAMRLERANPDLTYEQLREEIGAPETLVAPSAEAALTDSGWWLTSLTAADARGAEAVWQAFPSLAAGRVAADARESDEFTEWDGFVPAARALLDPRASRKPVSVTRLERLVSCPFRYFVEHGLGLEVMDGDPDHDEWLDPLQRGAALHEIFARLCREARAADRRLNPRRDAFRARKVADEALAALRAACPPPSEVVFDRERAELLRDVELFVEFEAAREESEPVAFEVAFGHDDGGEEPLAQGDPVEIVLGKGESFLLRGTIDRIDRLPDGSYEVIDYKTGKYDRARWRGTFRGGAMLQHALYGVAAAGLLRRADARARVRRGVYEFPSARGGGERVAVDPPDAVALARVLSDLFDVMAAGAFVPADQEKECQYCDFSRACHTPVDQATVKLANGKNSVLDPYRRLRSHE